MNYNDCKLQGALQSAASPQDGARFLSWCWYTYPPLNFFLLSFLFETLLFAGGKGGSQVSHWGYVVQRWKPRCPSNVARPIRKVLDGVFRCGWFKQKCLNESKLTVTPVGGHKDWPPELLEVFSLVFTANALSSFSFSSSSIRTRTTLALSLTFPPWELFI